MHRREGSDAGRFADIYPLIAHSLGLVDRTTAAYTELASIQIIYYGILCPTINGAQAHVRMVSVLRSAVGLNKKGKILW